MKHYSLIKIFAYSAILITAMAFSCQDHYEPEPVSNCNRVDGTPRALPCEFEVTRVEFYKTNTKEIIETIDAQHLQGGLIRGYAARVQPLTGHDGQVFLVFNTKVYVKRIANSPSPDWKKYRVAQFKLGMHPVHGDIIDFPVQWRNDPAYFQEIPSWAVGETKTFETLVGFESYPEENIDIYCPIINYNAWEKLVAPPYNYELVRDVAEATLKYKIQMRLQ